MKTTISPKILNFIYYFVPIVIILSISCTGMLITTILICMFSTDLSMSIKISMSLIGFLLTICIIFALFGFMHCIEYLWLDIITATENCTYSELSHDVYTALIQYLTNPWKKSNDNLRSVDLSDDSSTNESLVKNV